MKATKKIVGATCALVAAVALSAGSTFAWFSANTTVSATGMNIEVQSNSTYLLVSRSNTSTTAPANAAAIQGENSGKGFTSVNLATGEATALFPVATGSVGEQPNYTVTPITPGTGVTSFSWYTMNGTDASNGTGVDKSARQVTENLSNYVLSYTLYFTVASGSNAATQLKASCEVTGSPAVNCIVVGESNSVLFNSVTDTSDTVLVASIADTEVKRVTIYVYYDGTHSSINTNNFSSISDTTISLSFECTPGAQSGS